MGEGNGRWAKAFGAPPVFLSFSWCPASFQLSIFSALLFSLVFFYLLIFITVPFHLSPPSLSLIFFHFSHLFSLPSLCFSSFLADPLHLFIVHLSWLLPSPSQSVSPVGPPGSLFLVPCSSSLLSPPADHPRGCGPGCHQWRNQRQLLHHVSSWLFGCCGSHLRGW